MSLDQGRAASSRHSPVAPLVALEYWTLPVRLIRSSDAPGTSRAHPASARTPSASGCRASQPVSFAPTTHVANRSPDPVVFLVVLTQTRDVPRDRPPEHPKKGNTMNIKDILDGYTTMMADLDQQTGGDLYWF